MEEVSLGVIDERLKNFIDSNEKGHKAIESKMSEIHEQVKYTNGRVSALERWKWYISGGAIVVIALVGILADKITGLI